MLAGLASCGGGSDSSSAGTGQLSLGITDAPVDSAVAVVIHVTSVTVHGEEGNIEGIVTDPVSGNVGYDIDLLALQGGQWTGIFDEEIPAGHYSWIRLGLDLDQSYIQVGGTPYPLECNSCNNNGYKLVTSFDVEADAKLALMLDFDLRKSITQPSNEPHHYKLRPTVRVVETEASGSISGTVDGTLIGGLGGEEGCSVYVFEGSDATLDDVYIPLDGVPATQNNPVSTAMVIYDDVDDMAYEYTVPFLPAGSYSVALTCEAENDSADSDDLLAFCDPVNETVVAGTDKTVDFMSCTTPP
jgi:hypothetical protein